MNHLTRLVLAAFVMAAAALGQPAMEIRDVEIDSQSPEGAVLTEAGIAEEASERIGVLAGFLEQFPESTYRGYVLLQLQGLHTQQQNWSEAARFGEELLRYVPNDLEVRHNHNQALLNSQQWASLLPALAETKPLAEKEVAAPPPDDPTEDEEMIHQSSVDYANGVIQYTEWAMNVGATSSEPTDRIQFMEKFKELYPESQYVDGINERYIMAFQQLGDPAKLTAALLRVLVDEPDNEQYVHLLAQVAIGQQNHDAAITHAGRLVELMEEKAAPEGYSGEDWDARKKTFLANGNYILGTSHFQKGAFRTARRHLLQTVDVVKAEGGDRYGLLAYMLGFCYVKLDIAGDNIRQATHWMGEAARVPNPMQAQAAETLKKIEEAQ